MTIRYTAHAVRQVVLRDIDVRWVEEALTSPDWTAPDPNPVLTRSFKAIGGFSGRVLRVVHRRSGDDILVVTAHFDRGAKP